MNITVIGSGYVGTTAAAIFALSGHTVTALDIDSKKVDLVNSGKAPFFEAGLDNLIAEGVARGTLRATTSYKVAIPDADAIFSCVGTPDLPDGSSNLQYVFDAAKEAASYMKDGAIYIQKSTVPVGTGKEVLPHLPEGTPYVSNPEFLRESTAIYDTIFFDRVVAGGSNEDANQTILSIHKDVESHSQEIAEISGIEYNPQELETHSGEYISTRLESAELIKVTSNAFLALKITFANSVAKLADKTDANVDEVMSVVGSDARIGSAFFNVGIGYGGGCFPKDVSGLIASARKHGAPMPIIEAVQDVNATMPEYAIERLKQNVDIKGSRVAVLGLAFKAGTSDTRKSPAIQLANLLVKEGALVSAYDPEAMDEARHDKLSDQVNLTNSTKECVIDADVICIATEWSEFKNFSDWLPADKKLVLLDAKGCIDNTRLPNDIVYIGIGK